MKMKLTHLMLLLLALILGLHNLPTTLAEDVDLPVISKPSLLIEGTQRSLTQAQINELLPWAKTSKISLNDLLDEVKDMSINEKIERLSEGLTAVVSESNPTSELFMRYVLNRALILQKILKEETEEGSVGVSDVKLRILMSSIKMAIGYYDIDAKMLNNQSRIKFASFGTSYALFLTDLSKSIFDSSAQFQIHKITLEWLAWDLYRDEANKAYAEKIVKIHNFLQKLPAASSLKDSEYLALIKKMRDLEEKLNVKEIVQKIIDNSTARELAISERVLIKSKTSGFLREAIVYANVSSSVPSNESNNTHYCVKFTSTNAEERFMGYENFVKRSDLYIASGCGDRFCVGQEVTERKTGVQFTIIGVDLNGDYAIKSNRTERVGVQDKDLK